MRLTVGVVHVAAHAKSAILIRRSHVTRRFLPRMQSTRGLLHFPTCESGASILTGKIAMDKRVGCKKLHAAGHIKPHLDEMGRRQEYLSVVCGSTVQQKVSEVPARGKLQNHHQLFALCANPKQSNDLQQHRERVSSCTFGKIHKAVNASQHIAHWGGGAWKISSSAQFP